MHRSFREQRWHLRPYSAAGTFNVRRISQSAFAAVFVFALDMMEELRAALCDRFVISLFNLGQLSLSDFEVDGEAVYLDERGRKTLLTSWQKRKGETIVHPFLQEKIPIGLIPYAQAMLFARVLRGDLDRYPSFVWR